MFLLKNRKTLSYILILLISPFFTLSIKAESIEADSLYSRAVTLAKQNDFQNALALFLDAKLQYETDGLYQTKEYAKLLHNIGISYACLNDLDSGINYTKQALDLQEKLIGKEDEDYISSLNDYAQMISCQSKFDEATSLQEQVIKLSNKLPQKPKDYYDVYAYNMGRYYFLVNNYKDAAIYFEQALPAFEKFSDSYGKILEWIAQCYIETKDQENLSKIYLLIDEVNQEELKKDCHEPTCMKERAEYFAVTGDDAKAKECYLEALSMDMTDQEKIIVYESYAQFLSTSKDYASSAQYYILATTLFKDVYGENEGFLNMVYSTALTCLLGKRYEDAVKYFDISIEGFSKLGTKEAMKKVNFSRKEKASALIYLKKYDEAEKEYSLAINYYKIYDPENKEYPSLIVKLANLEKSKKNYLKAIKYYEEALQIYKQRSMSDEYENTYNQLYLCYALEGITPENRINEDTEIQMQAKQERDKKLDDIIQTEKNDLELTRTYLGEIVYANSLATIAGSYYLKEDFDNAIKYYEQYMESIRNAVRDEFRLKVEKERMILWNSQTENINEFLEILLTLPQDKQYLLPQASSIAYDAALLSKGILLNSSIEFEKVLLETKDENLQKIYQETIENSKKIERLRESALSEKDMDEILTLTRENQTLQLELYKGCSQYQDFTNYIQYRWQDIQAAIRAEDLAIEFVEIDMDALDKYNYIIALILSKDAASPIAIPICDVSQAKQMVSNNKIFDSPESIWLMLEGFLQGKKRLFFSSDGVLNNIGIEYLQFEGEPLSDKMEVYRLSSTKELCLKHSKMEIKDVAIFGGINYNAISQYDKSNETSDEGILDDKRGYSGAKKFKELENSLREVEDIEKICKDNKIPNIELYTGISATESKFRALDNSNLNLLHIATHGMYKANEKASDKESMENSLLIFAGANIGGDKTSSNDGILSAQDVATMNLRSCNLAVLSACETGLGKLSDDGVFGLQRGFKNAGVESLLMSLVPVYDTATTELMISFYHHLISGKSSHESFFLAQRELRDKGYKDSKYWATFILLDAID